MEAKMVRLILQEIEQEMRINFPVNAFQEMQNKARKNSSAAKATVDDYIYTYQEKIKSYVFYDEDMNILLEKIVEDYEPFIFLEPNQNL